MISAGDVVMLKSGGPKMTVVKIDGTDAAVAWFVDGDVKSARFAVIVLTKIG